MNEICSHMKDAIKPPHYWEDYQNCLNASLLCNGSRSVFHYKFYGTAKNSIKNGWMNDFFPSEKLKQILCTNINTGEQNILENIDILCVEMKLKRGLVQDVLRSAKKSHRGYTFKYIESETN